MRASTVLTAAIISAWRADACSFASSGLAPPDDALHRRLKSLGETIKTGGRSSGPGVLPDPIDMSRNGFVSHSLLRPGFHGGDAPLIETLLEFQAKSNEDLCYWSFQALPPPVGGPSLLHPFRKYWDVDDGNNDQDIEWVQAYGEVAAARLHQMQLDGGRGGPVAGAMCSIGRSLLKRRCDNGRSNRSKCSSVLMNQTLRWPMAIAIFNISEQLSAAVTNWRGNASHHVSNIQWTFGAGSKATSPWNGGGPVGVPGDVDPPGMPHGPDWPVSKGVAWGSSPGLAMIAKVMPCSQIPSKLMYARDLNYCDHVEDGKNVSATDEAYATWRSIRSVWPPTSACKDDLEALVASLNISMPSILPVSSCAEALKKLQAAIPNYGCSIPSSYPRFRDVCCSACGSEAIPDFPTPGPSPAPKVAWECSVCVHVYDPAKDGAGKAFEDLPDTWRCPVCGSPKSKYYKTSNGAWIHTRDEVVV